MMTNDEAEQEELEAQLRTTMEGLQRAVMRLFQDGEVHPHTWSCWRWRGSPVRSGPAWRWRGAGPGGAAGRPGRGRASGRARVPRRATGWGPADRGERL